MPDSTPPPPPPRPTDAWFDADPPPAGAPAEPVDLVPDPPTVAPVARTRLNSLPEARTVSTGPRVNPRPIDAPRRPRKEDRAVETDRPRAQVFLACSVLMAIIAAMVVAVAVLGYAIVAGFKKAQDRAKANEQRPGAVRDLNPRVPGANPRVPPRNRVPAGDE